MPDNLTSLLSNPSCVGVRCAPGQMDPPGSQFDEEQYVDGFEPDRLHREEIASQDLILVVPKEAAPGSSRSLRGWCNLMPFENATYRRGAQPVAKLKHFPLDLVVAPAMVLFRQTYDQGFKFR